MFCSDSAIDHILVCCTWGGPRDVMIHVTGSSGDPDEGNY